MIEAASNHDRLLSRERGVQLIPCWLCNSPIPVKFTKKNKAYLICDNCGVQTFLRYNKAEELLAAKIKQCQGAK